MKRHRGQGLICDQLKRPNIRVPVGIIIEEMHISPRTGSPCVEDPLLANITIDSRSLTETQPLKSRDRSANPVVRYGPGVR